MTTDLDAKVTWAETQGYQSQDDKSNEKSVNEWNEEMMNNGKKNKNKLKLVGAPLIDFFECKKVILGALTLHLRLHRTSSDFALTCVAKSEDKFVPVIERASLFVTKMIVRDAVRLSIEKVLLKAPAH